MAKYLILLTLFASLAALALSTKVDFKDCSDGKGKGEILSVEISPCPEQPCILKRGTTVHVNVTFVPHEELTAPTSVVHGVIAGIPIPFPLPNPNACKDCNLKCPLEAGQKFIFQSSLDVKSAYPAIKLIVRWEMKDKASNDVFCWQIPTQLQ